MFWEYHGSPTSRASWISVAIIMAVFFAAAGIGQLYSGSDCTRLVDENGVIRARISADGSMDALAEDGIKKLFQKVIEDHIPGMALLFENPDVSWDDPRLIVVLSYDFSFIGKSGRTADGRGLILINPAFAHESAILDEMAHQLRGHVCIPRLPGPLELLHVPINMYLDTTNVLWWYGLDLRLWSVWMLRNHV